MAHPNELTAQWSGKLVKIYRNNLHIANVVSTLLTVLLLTACCSAQVKPGSFVHVGNFSKSGPQQQTIINTMDFIRGYDDAKCAAWFPALKGGIKSLEGDASVPDTVLIGHGKITPGSIVAFTGSNPKQTDLPVGVIVAFNDDSVFFTDIPGYNNGGFEGGTNQSRVLTVIHELGHMLDATGIMDDFASQDKVNANNDLVKKNCGATVKAAKKVKAF